MKSNQLVSIIMTCFNGDKYLKESIASIMNQTHKEWEIIFVDNNSTDQSRDIILSYDDNRIKYFKLTKTLNLGSVRNFAFSKCVGKYIAFLDVDDYWDKQKLSKQLVKFNTNQNIDIVYCNYVKFSRNEHKKIKKELFSGYCQQNIIESYIKGKPLTAWLTLMIKKKCMDKLDYSFDEKLHICSDFDLVLRLSGNCYFDYNKEFLSYYRAHSMNESKNTSKEISELAYIIKKFYQDKKISNILKTNNFLDKILLKNFINNRISNKNTNSDINFSNLNYKILFLFIKFFPNFLIKLLK